MNTRKLINVGNGGFLFFGAFYFLPKLTFLFEALTLPNLAWALSNSDITRISMIFFLLLTAYGVQLHIRAGNRLFGK